MNAYAKMIEMNIKYTGGKEIVEILCFLLIVQLLYWVWDTDVY